METEYVFGFPTRCRKQLGGDVDVVAHRWEPSRGVGQAREAREASRGVESARELTEGVESARELTEGVGQAREARELTGGVGRA
jgi:hypothetical protein